MFAKIFERFHNLAVNKQKSFTLSDEHIRQRILHYYVPFGNMFFFMQFILLPDGKKTLASVAQFDL